MKNKLPDLCLVSACLAGLPTRYDCQIKTSNSCLELLKDKIWIPVCPEQLGGLPTPRPAANIINGSGHEVLSGDAQVIDNTGQDVTKHFVQGAHAVLAIAKAQNINLCYLKSRSPSCGVHEVCGVLAALLSRNNIELVEF